MLDKIYAGSKKLPSSADCSHDLAISKPVRITKIMLNAIIK